MPNDLICPVDNVLVNENKVRLVALQVFVLAVFYLFLPLWIIPAFLVVDFFLRGFKLGKYSAAGFISGWIISALSLGNKPIDQAPKIFAAQLGFAITGLLLIANLLGYPMVAFGMAGILVIFSFLEWALNICAGCYVYTFLQKFSRKP